MPWATKEEVKLLREVFDARLTPIEREVGDVSKDVRQILGWMQAQVAKTEVKNEIKDEAKSDRRWFVGFVLALIGLILSCGFNLVHDARGATGMLEGSSGISTAVQHSSPKPRPDAWPLHVGSHGPRVCNLEWLLSGHKPNVFTKVQRTYSGPIDCRYGAMVEQAQERYKWRIGYPEKNIAKGVGPYFVGLLLGHKTRPTLYVRNAAWRLKEVEPGVTIKAAKIRQVALSQLGVTESWGDNWGPQVEQYQAVTGAYHAAWCVSFVQWVFVHAGIGTFANRSAGVFYVVDWARARSYLFAKPKVGSLVAFLNNGGHMGIVIKVTAHGFVSVEGNASNRVLERFHTIGERPMVFVRIPAVFS